MYMKHEATLNGFPMSKTCKVSVKSLVYDKSSTQDAKQ